MVILVGLLLLGAIGYAGIASLGYLNTLYMSIDTQVAKVTAIASIVTLFCTLILANGIKSVSKNFDTTEMIILYQFFLEYYSEKIKDKSGIDCHKDKLSALEQRLALHGSPKVITAYLNLRKLAANEVMHVEETQEQFKKMLLAMRADIGRSELNVNKKDLLDLLLGRQ